MLISNLRLHSIYAARTIAKSQWDKLIVGCWASHIMRLFRLDESRTLDTGTLDIRSVDTWLQTSGLTTRAKKGGHWALGLWTLVYLFSSTLTNIEHVAITMHYITKDTIVKNYLMLSTLLWPVWLYTYILLHLTSTCAGVYYYKPRSNMES